MQEDFRLIIDLVAVLGAAVGGGLLASFGRLPILLGYLGAGMVVGPSCFGLIKEVVQVETLAQFGVAFLLFTLGVEFSFSELRKVQWISLGGGTLQILLTILVTTLVSLGVGWVSYPAQGVFLGAILSLSSTAVVLKSLAERNETDSPQGQVMLGILIVQDLAVGLMLAVLPALDKPPAELGEALVWSLVQIFLFATGAVAAGVWVIPPLLRLLARTESRELFLLGVVAICLGIALLTEHLGLSIEMGAFVAGLMISEAEYADQTLTYVEPLRDIFATLFFAAIGMLIDPQFLWDNLELILGLVALVLVGKFLIITPLVWLFRYPLSTALIAGLGLAQIGEFSFVLASEGQSLGLVSRRVYLLILGTTAVTLVLTPFILRLVPGLLSWAEQQSWWPKAKEAQAIRGCSSDLPHQNHIIVCGYGQAGQNIVQILRERNYPVLVIDQSEQKAEQLREAGIPYLYGNATSNHVLNKAMVDQARAMAITLPDPLSTRLCLKRSLEFAPDLDVVVRASQPENIEVLYQLGAKEVVQPDFEASLELATHLLGEIGMPLGAVHQNIQAIRASRYLALRPAKSAETISREVQDIAQAMNSTWYTLGSESTLVGLTLEEADLRRLTGVTLMAIRRAAGPELDYPPPETVLEPGDRLLLVGNAVELEALDKLASGGTARPESNPCCQWLALVDQSPALGKTISDLAVQERYGIQIQGIRRQNQLIRFPSPDHTLEKGDRILLCGGYTSLTEISEWLSPSYAPHS